MMEFVVRSCGVFFVPQLVLSALTVALVLGYTIAWVRGELRRDHPTWERTLDPLAGVAVTVGLLGSVVSFCVAFGGFTNAGFEIQRITAGLTTAYTTTAVGLVTSLVASLGAWVFSVAVKR